MGDGVGVAGSGVGAGGKSGRVIKEEQLFNELGYLVPPDPYNEFERRRALYKSVAVFFFFGFFVFSPRSDSDIEVDRFNIWNTGPDPNFDRIAHLAKLVFNAKGVMISLIDENEQWFKSECVYLSLWSFFRLDFVLILFLLGGSTCMC